MSKLVIPDNFIKEVNVDIAVNQIAYGINDEKKAVCKNDITGQFFVVNAQTDEAVFEGKISGKKFDATNAIYVTHADFSSVKEEGKYYIATEKGVSYTFEISKNPYEDVTKAMIKALYFQRCGMDLEEKHAGPYTHKACYNLPADLITDPSFNVEDV